MAKKKPSSGGINKSDAIREVLASQPKAGVKDNKAKLEAKGINASDALINKIKYTPKAKRRKTARAKSGTSKADAIRGMFKQLGRDARPRDVIESLKRQGVTVTSAQVSMLRGKASKNGAVRQAGTAVSYDHLVAAKQLADRLGGVENARRALESFAKLVHA